MKKAKWLPEEALPIPEKRREVKSKGEKESYTHLNADLEGIARTDKKAYLSDQCKQTDENRGVGDGQGGLACCSPRGRKELDTTEQLN